MREKLSIGDKLSAIAGPVLPTFVGAALSHRQPGVILFTSGTEGEPKGVVLSHENIMANIEQVRAHIGLSPDTDIVFNPLPTFHCFGLTVGALLPLIAGLKVVFHPLPAAAQGNRPAYPRERRDNPARHRHVHLAIRPDRRGW